MNSVGQDIMGHFTEKDVEVQKRIFMEGSIAVNLDRQDVRLRVLPLSSGAEKIVGIWKPASSSSACLQLSL